ncbi:MAG: ATP-binding protein [Flavobacteriales bacterium]
MVKGNVATYNYQKLLEKYQELELRVTKFSTIEQELINTRDKLDHELVMYKRLNEFSAKILDDIDDDQFHQLTVEAAIDIMEFEQSALLIHKHNSNSPSILFSEGLKISSENLESFSKELRKFSQSHPLNKAVLINEQIISESDFLKDYSSGIYYHSYDSEYGESCFLLVLISKENAPLYTNIHDRHKAIFTSFVHHVHSVATNRKKNEKIKEQFQKISTSEVELRKLSLIATKTKNGVIISDNHGRVEWVNEAFEKMSGYTLEEVKGLKPKDFLQPEEENLNLIERKNLTDSLSKKENIEVTLLNKHKNGKSYYNSVEITPVFDEAGKHINFIALQKDITQDILSQREILRVNSKFEKITSMSGIGIWESDIKTSKVNWNEILLLQYGIDDASQVSNFFDFWKSSIHEDDVTRVSDIVDHMMATGKDFIELEYRIRTFSEKKIKFLKCVTIAERDEKGNLIRLIGSSLDITATREAEIERTNFIQQINSLKMFYENILNNSPAKIAVFDSTLKLIYANERLLELEPHWKERVNTSISGERESEQISNLISKIENAISSKQLTSFEEVLTTNKGVEKHILRNILPHFNSKGKLEYVIMSGVNITDLKQFESSIILKNEELRKINSELDNFVYSVSHDLRSPLLAIKGILHLVFKSEHLDAQLKHLLTLANNSVQRLDGTIQEILEYSRNSRLDVQISKFNIENMIQNIYDDLKFSVEDQVEMSIQNECGKEIISDQSRLNTILKNLIGNSFKYRKKEIAKTLIFVKIIARKDYLEISIEDNGEGISQEKLPRIFDMFYRGSSNSVGTGLGLYIVKEIVSKLQGTIRVESQEGVGTKFIVELPNSIQNA